MLFLSMMVTAFCLMLISTSWKPFHNKLVDFTAFIGTFFLLGRILLPIASICILRITKGFPK